ncbi:MAG TPA: hypothetical protein VFA51_00245 [Candidatus Udaeobacter sp.]|nr:hypothetical protein [Candidatus Udaeobacter sp.]
MKRFYAAVCIFCLVTAQQMFGQAGRETTTGPGSVIVRSRFGGQIFGFDIDLNGNTGVLSESQTLRDGTHFTAVETFDQTTGEIIDVLTMAQGQVDFVTLGVFDSVGLVEREREISFLHVRRTFRVINPLNASRFNGPWSPPLQRHIITKVKGMLGSPDAAAYAMDVSGDFIPLVFRSNVGTNTFGPMCQITDQDFTSGADPGFAYDSKMNRAVLGHARLGNPFVPGFIALVDLASGAFTKFRGVGLGDVNGLAVDPKTGTVCTTTEIDFSVQFYDLATQSGFSQPLPGATNQFFSGADVEWDPINHLFLVAQPNSSTAASGSSIHVYDGAGNLVESLNGFNFSNVGNVIPAHIALKPSNRTGFVDGPDSRVRELQSFTY